MSNNDQVWMRKDVSENYLTGVRGAIPLANAQIDIMLRLIKSARGKKINTILDLGCGDGILGQAVLNDYPDATGVFLDFSQPMLANARQQLAGQDKRVFIDCDYGDPAWTKTLSDHAPFDVIVSGFSIHHQPDDRKQRIYREIFELLSPNGIFLNLEHVSSPTEWLESQFDDLMVDALYQYARANNNNSTRQQFAQDYHARPDDTANILAPVETQLDWLRDIGFQQVDCYFKVFELALFGGIRAE